MRAVAPVALLLLGAVAACGDSTPGAAGSGDERIEPELAAVNLDGDSVSLAGLRGHPALVNVWATWCAPCRREIPVLQSLHDEYAPRGLQVIGVTVDARGADADVRRFVDEFGMTYPVWWDPDQRVLAQVGAVGVPITLLLDRDGRVAWSHLGILNREDPGLVDALRATLDGSTP